ncbi:MAG: alpha/beta hydrolase [Acidobacteriota bacterium]
MSDRLDVVEEIAAGEAAAPVEPTEAAAAERLRLAQVAPWMAAVLGSVGGIGALGYRLRGRYQDNTVYLPDRYPNGVWNPSVHGVAAEDVWFRSADGVDLHGWWIVHPKAGATILYCHGSSGSIAHRIGVFRQLAKLRVNVFAFDYRGYGRSAGVPSEGGLYADVRAAYDHLTGAMARDPREIVLFGHSLGGAVAIDAAADRPVAGLVVQSSFTDVRDMARVLYPQLPLHWITRNEFRSIDKVGLLSLPKLFIHGTEDGTVPLDLGRRLFEAAAEPKELYVVERAGHNDVHLHGGSAYQRRLARFTKSCVRA